MLQIVRAIPLLLLIVGMYLFYLTSTLVCAIYFLGLQGNYIRGISNIATSILSETMRKKRKPTWVIVNVILLLQN